MQKCSTWSSQFQSSTAHGSRVGVPVCKIAYRSPSVVLFIARAGFYQVLGVCVVIPFILDVGLADAPAGVTQEGHTGFLHILSAVLAWIFLARRIQRSLSLVDSEVEFCVPTNKSFST